MNDSTVASKLNRLLQKSRQAYRVYASMSKSSKLEGNFFSELQANEWMKVNNELIKQLSHLAENKPLKNLQHNIARIKHSLELDCTSAERLLDKEQKDLTASSKRGDFIHCAQLSSILISRKSFIQASKAAIFELSSVCGSSGIKIDQNPVTHSLIAKDSIVSMDAKMEEELNLATEIKARSAKVIQLRR